MGQAYIETAGLVIHITVYYGIILFLLVSIFFYFLGSVIRKKALKFGIAISLGFLIEGFFLKIDTNKLNYNYNKENQLEKVIKLCNQHSVNRVYDEKLFIEFKEKASSRVLIDSDELPVETDDFNKIKEVLLSVESSYSPDMQASFLYLPKNGFISYYYINKEVRECKNGECKMKEGKIFDIKSKKLVFHTKDLRFKDKDLKDRYVLSCSTLKVGDFKEDIF